MVSGHRNTAGRKRPERHVRPDLRRADGGDLRAARPGSEVGRGTVSREPGRPGAGGPARAVSLRRPALPGEVLVSSTTAGILFLASLIIALAAVHVPLGDYMYRVYASPKDSRAERVDLPVDRRRPEVRADVGRLRAQCAGLLGGQRPVPVPLPAGAGQIAAASQRSRHADDAGAGVEHRGQLRHQYELAGLLRRVDAGPSRADGRPGCAELRVRRGRHGRRDGVRPRVRPPQHRRAGQLLGRPGARHHPHPAAALDHRRHHPDRRRRHPELRTCTTRWSTPLPAPSRPSPAVRSPARRPSRNSAPTGAGSTTPTRRILSRTPPRGPTGSRSSCWPASRSRSPAPSAGWSTAASRATRSPRRWR